MRDLTTALGEALGLVKEAELPPYLKGRAAKGLAALALTGAGALGGGLAASRKRMTVAQMDTPSGRFNVVGEKRYIKDIAQAVEKKDPQKLWEASKRILVLSGPGGSKTGAMSPTTAKALKASLLAAGAGAAGVGVGYGTQKGKEFTVVDTPIGVLGGRRRDIRRMEKSVSKGDVEGAREALSRTVPVHPAFSAALRSSNPKTAEILEAMKEAAAGGLWSKLVAKAKGLRGPAKSLPDAGGTWGKVKGVVAGPAASKADEMAGLMGARGKVQQVEGIGARTAPGTVPSFKTPTPAPTPSPSGPTTAPAPTESKPLLSRKAKWGIGLTGTALGAGYLGTKALGGAKDIAIESMRSQTPNYMGAIQYS